VVGGRRAAARRLTPPERVERGEHDRRSRPAGGLPRLGDGADRRRCDAAADRLGDRVGDPVPAELRRDVHQGERQRHQPDAVDGDDVIAQRASRVVGDHRRRQGEPGAAAADHVDRLVVPERRQAVLAGGGAVGDGDDARPHRCREQRAAAVEGRPAGGDGVGPRRGDGALAQQAPLDRRADADGPQLHPGRHAVLSRHQREQRRGLDGSVSHAST